MTGCFYIAIMFDSLDSHLNTITSEFTKKSVLHNSNQKLHCLIYFIIRNTFLLLHLFKSRKSCINVLLILFFKLLLFGYSFRILFVGSSKSFLLLRVFKCSFKIITKFAYHTDDWILPFTPISEKCCTTWITRKKIGKCFFPFFIARQFFVQTVVFVVNLSE